MEVDTSIILGLLSLLVLLVLTCFSYLIYCGLLTEINVGTKPNLLRSLTIAYKFARGPYKNAGNLFTEVHELTPDLNCIGVYYDKPDEVTPERLRYAVGAILSEGEQSPDENLKELLEKKGYRVMTFPPVSHAVVTTFPFVNMLSIFIAIIRVYPRIQQYISEKSLSAHPMMEIYADGLIHFIAPLARQDEYYVAESLEEDEDGEDSVVSGDGDDSVVTDTEPLQPDDDHAEATTENVSDKDESSPSVQIPSITKESPSSSETQQEKLDDVEGRSSEARDDESSASSSFEELTLDAS